MFPFLYCWGSEWRGGSRVSRQLAASQWVVAHLARTGCQKPSPAPSTALLPVKGEGCRPCVAPGRQESAAETAELNKSRARYAWCQTSAGSYL